MYQVVLVDDEPLVVEGLKNAIDWSGFHFEIACATTEPMAALEYMKNNPVHLLLTDISMPKMSGIELIKKAKEYNSLLSVLVLSAYDTFDYVRSAMRHGAENYLLKPLNPEELSDSVSIIVSHFQERDALSGIYGGSMLTFRSSFVENWVKDTYSGDELLTRAEMLGINLQLDNYTVCIISSAENNNQGISQLFDMLLSLFVGTFISHFYFETPSCLVCIISTCSMDNDISQLISKIISLRPILNFPYFISTGNTVNSYDEVGTSYRNANKYLFLQYSPLPSIIYQEDLIPPAVQRLIERSYKDMDFPYYLISMEGVLLHASGTGRRMAYQLAVISWGVSQTALDQKPDPNIIPLLADIICDGDDLTGMTAYLKTFLEISQDILNKRKQEQSYHFPSVNAVIRTIEDFSTNKDVSLKTLAAKMNMHPSYLGTIFRQQTGYYFNDYLNDTRLKYAAELLENTDMKLKDIVARTGFSSQTYFNRLFKCKYDVSPNIYRTNIRLK